MTSPLKLLVLNKYLAFKKLPANNFPMYALSVMLYFSDGKLTYICI